MENRLHIILILALLVLTSQACQLAMITGSGEIITQDEDVADFDKLDVTYGFVVDIYQGESFNVVIRADDNLIEDVRLSKHGSTLYIGLEPGRDFNLVNATLEADITMPDLSQLEMSGGSHLTFHDFTSSSNLKGELSGGTHLKGDLSAGNVTFIVSGGSDVELSGSAGDLEVKASGGSHVRLGDFSVVDANIDASGGSHVTVYPSGTLDADASGGAHVKYRGNPTLGILDDDTSSSIKPD